MRVAIVIFCIGERYINIFNIKFREGLEAYCKKWGYVLIIRSDLIRHEPNLSRKKFFWQRFLIPDAYRNYDFVISMDSDIYVNLNAPPFPLDSIPVGKIAVVNERKYMENYEWREKVQRNQGWTDITGKDWYALSGEHKTYNDHINGGLVIYQPAKHADLMLQLYNEYSPNFAKYHQDDQSFLSSYIIDNDLVWWLDQRFNRVWFFWREIFYPMWGEFTHQQRKKIIANFIDLNYFCHFTSGHDIEYL